MGRNILGAVLGYVVMFIFIFATFTAAYLLMGDDTAFAPGSYDVSMTWIVVSMILGFVGTIAAGYTAKLIGRSAGAVKILAGFVLVLGTLMVIATVVSPKPAEARSAATSNMEAMNKARTPLWVATINPVVGLVGVLIGGSLRKES